MILHVNNTIDNPDSERIMRSGQWRSASTKEGQVASELRGIVPMMKEEQINIVEMKDWGREGRGRKRAPGASASLFSLEIDTIMPADLSCMEHAWDLAGLHPWGGCRVAAPGPEGTHLITARSHLHSGPLGPAAWIFIRAVYNEYTH